MPKPLRHWLFFLILPLLPAGAQSPAPAEPLKVAVIQSPPFTEFSGGVWTGYAVDLWEKIAEMNQWAFTYTEFPTPEAALAAIQAGKIQVLVNDTDITSERQRVMDFSHPFFRSGLQIMVVEDRPRTFGRLASEILGLGNLRILWIAGGVVAVFTVLVTLFERRHNPDFPKKWADGFADAFYNVISVTLTGKSVYKGFPGVLGRLVMVGWMLLGLFVVAYVTSSITTAMTVEQLQGRINGPKDLPGKTVGVLEGDPGQIYAAREGLQFMVYSGMDAAAAALVHGELQAIVADAPILQYYDRTHPRLPITEVGVIFDPHTDGFALPKNSALRVPLNEALLSLSENGYLDDLGKRYFGTVFQR